MDAFHSHLQELSGTDANLETRPVVFTAGLPSICGLWFTLIERGGADVLMCSTAYGGSSQMTDLVSARTPKLRKHTFDIQGVDTDIISRIGGALDALAAKPQELQPTTVLFVEIPTNPDMKVPDLPALAALVEPYHAKTGKEVLVLVDATFAPGSKVIAQLGGLAPSVNIMTFLSMSKSVSRGLTTAGALVANATAAGAALIADVGATAAALGTTAHPEQMESLCANHRGVEERCAKAYAVAVNVGTNLQAAVERATGYRMPLAFVQPKHAELGFTSSTFSFNLPRPAGASDEACEALAQRFVDLCGASCPIFKPCVSFGQDNDLVYATVPATSTQGAIKAEDKAKQAVGGVQLVRLSFPPTCDTACVNAAVDGAIEAVYPKDPRKSAMDAAK